MDPTILEGQSNASFYWSQPVIDEVNVSRRNRLPRKLKKKQRKEYLKNFNDLIQKVRSEKQQ